MSIQALSDFAAGPVPPFPSNFESEDEAVDPERQDDEEKTEDEPTGLDDLFERYR